MKRKLNPYKKDRSNDENDSVTDTQFEFFDDLSEQCGVRVVAQAGPADDTLGV
jgi:hypothetical protein